MADDIVIDGAALDWSEFADRLLTLERTDARFRSGGYVRPPRGCAAAAERLIADLDLDDCIVLVEAIRSSARPRRQWRWRGSHALAMLWAALSQPLADRSRPVAE